MQGKVYLAGAGCGDPGLITKKAVDLLKSCDTVLYDSLAAPELLEYVPLDCECIHVGKRYGGHAMAQKEINRLLVEKAREGKLVVRLKGGDPFVFGRGGEEMQALAAEGIACEEVPGITSAVAVPAAAGIPVTHRGLSRSFTVLTASSVLEEENGEELTGMDYRALAKTGGTLVILMGMHHLEELVCKLIEGGKPPYTPAAVIMEGTRASQKCVRAALEKLPQEARKAGLCPPAVIVVGECAALELNLLNKPPREEEVKPGPLSGIRIGVTGTGSFARRVCKKLRPLGAEPVNLSFLEPVWLKEKLPGLSGYTYLVFTSGNGVRIFFERMRAEKRDLREMMHMKLAVIGTGTKEKLEEYGFLADLVPQIYDAAHLGESLSKAAETKDRILLVRAKQASPLLTRALEEKGVAYTDFALYDLRTDEKKRLEAFRRSREGGLSWILFGSASGVHTFFGEAGAILPEGTRLACIGTQCAQALEGYGIKGAYISREATIDGMLSCVSELEKKRKRERDA